MAIGPHLVEPLPAALPIENDEEEDDELPDAIAWKSHARPVASDDHAVASLAAPVVGALKIVTLSTIQRDASESAFASVLPLSRMPEPPNATLNWPYGSLARIEHATS